MCFVRFGSHFAVMSRESLEGSVRSYEKTLSQCTQSPCRQSGDHAFHSTQTISDYYVNIMLRQIRCYTAD